MNENKSPVSFKSLIKKEFVRSALIPIIIIEIMLLILYFSINSYKNIRTKNTLLSEARESLNEITLRESQKINYQFMQVSNVARVLQSENERFFKNPTSFKLPGQPPVMKIAENGTMYKENNDGGGSIYYSGLNAFTPYHYNKAAATEAFDPLYKVFTDIDPNIVAIYFNSFDNLNRYYPFIDKTYEQYPANMRITDYNFYYEADSMHNPSRGVVWTDAYLDPAGMGWMASCIVPVYNGNFLEGVTGIDITVEKFITNILAMKLPWQGSPFLIDEHGVILAMPKSVQELLGMNELTRHDYKETIKQTTYKPDDFNLLKNKNIPTGLKDFFTSGRNLTELKIGGKVFLISQQVAEETGWRLYTLVDEDVVFASIYKLNRQSNILGYIAIAFLFLFYIPFFLYLIKKSEMIASRITAPVNYLLEATEKMTQKITLAKIEPVGVTEVDELSQNFNKMTDELKVMYESLEKKVEEGIHQLRERDHMLIKQSRQAAMGEMIQNIAHQWRQPLNSIGVIIQNIEDAFEYNELTHEYLEEKIARVMGMITYMSRTIDDFRNFFKPNKEKQNFKLSDSLNQVISLVDGSFKNNNIKLSSIVEHDVSVFGFENEFSQVLLNILNNAKEIIIERKIAEGWVSVRIAEENARPVICISDNGGGIQKGLEEKIFEPYFTSRSMGTGLGLYMAKTIVETSMEGRLSVKNTDAGASFEIIL